VEEVYFPEGQAWEMPSRSMSRQNLPALHLTQHGAILLAPQTATEYLPKEKGGAHTAGALVTAQAVVHALVWEI